LIGGHFVYAFNTLGIECKGVDISEKLVVLAKKAWNDSKFLKTDPPSLVSLKRII
tara:strand:+ start:93 stop:257 length:165 start_codon:yes stop_codon:yes gene_type:complete